MVPLTEMENLENEREKSGQFLTGLIEITTIYLGRNIPRAILEIVPALQGKRKTRFSQVTLHMKSDKNTQKKEWAEVW